MLPSCAMQLTAAVVSHGGLRSPRSTPICTLRLRPEMPQLTWLYAPSDTASPPAVQSKVNPTAQRTVYPLQQTGAFTHFFSSSSQCIGGSSLCRWRLPFCRALLKQPALLAFGPFYVSRVAQTCLSRPRDMSRHFWNCVSGWFIGLFVKSGDSIFAHGF